MTKEEIKEKIAELTKEIEKLKHGPHRSDLIRARQKLRRKLK